MYFGAVTLNFRDDVEIDFDFFPSPPSTKAIKDIEEREAVSIVRRALNAWEYHQES